MWSHVCFGELPERFRAGDELVDKGRVLDSFYIPARYPNSHSEGAPFLHYGKLQSTGAIGHAREIIDFVTDQMAR